MKSQQPVISVVGPTASGKTNRALKIAREAIADGGVAGVDLISVDSRQVYQGLEIMTGADVPEGFEKRQSYFALQDNSIRLFGVSMIQPSDEWSVAHFQNYARAIIIDSWSSNRLPILVGGTGLYHQEVFRQDKKLHVPPNEEVRKKAEGMSVGELQKWLGKVDNERLESMNESDRGNPRRLVRAIEVGIGRPSINRVAKNGHFEIPDRVRNDDMQKRDYDYDNIDWSAIKPKIVFVTADLDLIKEKIEKRVKERFENGAVDEVKWLLSLNLSPTLPVLTTLGVSEITKFLQGEISAEDCQKLWSLHEFQYAKRQLTWWKK